MESDQHKKNQTTSTTKKREKFTSFLKIIQMFTYLQIEDKTKIEKIKRLNL